MKGVDVNPIKPWRTAQALPVAEADAHYRLPRITTELVDMWVNRETSRLENALNLPPFLNSRHFSMTLAICTEVEAYAHIPSDRETIIEQLTYLKEDYLHRIADEKTIRQFVIDVFGLMREMVPNLELSIGAVLEGNSLKLIPMDIRTLVFLKGLGEF